MRASLDFGVDHADGLAADQVRRVDDRIALHLTDRPRRLDPFEGRLGVLGLFGVFAALIEFGLVFDRWVRPAVSGFRIF